MNKTVYNPQNIKVVVFDCDGVMFDTENTNRIYYNTLLSDFDMPELDEEQFRYVHMCTVKEAIHYLFENTGQVDKALEYAKNFSYAPLILHMIIEPDLRYILARLNGRYKTAIATNRSNTMQGVLSEHKLKDDFHLVVTSLDVQHPKPHPEQLYTIMKYFDCPPTALIYIGDSKTDEQAAKSSGVTFVAYNNKSLTADFYISSLKELEEILKLK